MSAAEKRLLRAADSMRDRALASLRDGSEARDFWTAGPLHDPENNGWAVYHRQQPDVDWDTTVAVLGYDFHGSTAKHIASWHPAVALAAAELLSVLAITAKEGFDHDPQDTEDKALAFAKAFLDGVA